MRLGIWLVLCGTVVLGQEQTRQPFRARVETAVYEVRVTLDSGRPIRGLSATDFLVSEGGRSRPITYFLESDGPPLRTALLLNTGSSMSEQEIIRGKRLIFELIHALDHHDQIQILTFDQEPHFLSPFTSDRFELLRALENIAPGGRPSKLSLLGRAVTGGGAAFELSFSAANSATALAVDKTLWRMRDEQPSKILVVISSGFGGLGVATIDHLQMAGARFFAVSVDHKLGNILSFGGDAAMKHRAVSGTGGVSFEADNILEQVEELRDAMKYYYWIGFEPTVEGDRRVAFRVPGQATLKLSSTPALTDLDR